MKNRLAIIVALSCLFLIGGGMGSVCGQGCATHQLERLAQQTGVALPLEDGIHYRYAQFKGQPVTVVVSNGLVTHIGHSLFTPAQRRFLEEDQCNFLERISLAGDLPDFFGIDFKQYLRDEKIEVLEGHLDNLKSIISDTLYSFQNTLLNGKGYVACWFTLPDNERFLALSYPANYHLIKGLSLTEAENNLFDQIKATKVDQTEKFDPEETLLHPLGDGAIYLLEGNAFFLPELNSNRYYVKESGNRFGLLCSESYPVETMANLVTGIELDHQFVMNVKLVKYGFHVDEFTMPLKSWIAFCLQSGCTPYFGIVSQIENKMVAELIMQNEALGYCHVMKLTFDPSIFKERRGFVQARLNSYVPMSNVKALFNDEKDH